MAWTAPRTWVDGEVTTAAIHNAHIRDNLNVLKVTRDGLGRLPALSSTYVANLSPANIPGVATVTADNDYTGRNRFQADSRVVLPVGADLYEDLGGGLRRGNWVEGDYLHHIASDQTTEYRFLGTSVGTPAGAVPGSLWVEENSLHYIDADGDERTCSTAGASGGPHTDTGALGGSAWVETYVHWIRESGSVEKRGHADVAHSDGTIHTDVHNDTAHSDSHGDSGHADSHGDAAHSDSHGDTHGDEPFIPPDPHIDFHADVHGDVNHQDTHSDVAHSDTSHGDVAHSDHTDTHTDHGDTAAQNQPTVVV